MERVAAVSRLENPLELVRENLHKGYLDELARQGIERVLGAAASGELKTIVGGTYPLEEAPAVHEKMAARRTMGKILLDPSL